MFFISTIIYPIIQYLNLIVLFTTLCTYGFYMSLILAFAYQVGWIHRIGWYIMELECRKILNGTPVTVGSYRVDIFRGKVWISNLIIHSPTNPINSVYSSQLKSNSGTDNIHATNNNSNKFNINIHRKPNRPPMEWKWEAPILARIGKVYVECNLIYCIFSLWFLWEEAPLELYTVHVSDIQAFVERRNNIYNFYLCDPHVIIPDVPTTTTNNHQSTTTTTKNNSSSFNTNNGVTTINHNDHSFIVEETGGTETVYNAATTSLSTSSTSVPKQALTTTSSVTSSLTEHNAARQHRHDFTRNRTRTSSLSPPTSPDRTTLYPPKSSSLVRPASTEPTDGLASATSSPQREKAQKVVDDMVSAVRRAATNGDWQSFLLQQRDVLTQQLRAWKDASSYQERGEVVSEGVKIIQQVSKSVVETTQQVTKVVLPARREKSPSEKTVYARIGRVLIENVRVFLHKQQQQQQVETANDEFHIPTVNRGVDDAGELSSHDENDLTTTTTTTNNPNPPTVMLSQHWNKSIYVHRVAIRASEFCPPLSAIDKNYRLDELSNDDNNNNKSSNTAAISGDIELDSNNKKTSSSGSSGSKKMPSLFQPIEKSLDVILKRMFAEMAKSNTDLFFKAAMEEMADVFATSTTTTTATTSNTTTSNNAFVSANTNNATTGSGSVIGSTMSNNTLTANE